MSLMLWALSSFQQTMMFFSMGTSCQFNFCKDSNKTIYEKILGVFLIGQIGRIGFIGIIVIVGIGGDKNADYRAISRNFWGL